MVRVGKHKVLFLTKELLGDDAFWKSQGFFIFFFGWFFVCLFFNKG